MKIKILFEDENLIVLIKPAGILVHPTSAQEKVTLMNWLIETHPEILKQDWPDSTRVGVVHRLDRDTAGILVMAKTPEILDLLQKQFKEREVVKTYLALVYGSVENDQGEISVPITRGEGGKQKIETFAYSFSKNRSRDAVTYYRVSRRFVLGQYKLTLLEVMPKTGRMHQIRTHLNYLGHPIIGDPLYNIKASRKISKNFNLKRQFLNAVKLEFTHPKTEQKMSFSADLDSELKQILAKLT